MSSTKDTDLLLTGQAVLSRDRLTQRHLGEIQPELIFGSWLPSQQVFPVKPRQNAGAFFCSSKLLRG